MGNNMQVLVTSGRKDKWGKVNIFKAIKNILKQKYDYNINMYSKKLIAVRISFCFVEISALRSYVRSAS